MGQSPDLDASWIFVKVVEAGSFRGAARALGVPKTTVSRRVAELEERLGVRLLQRTTRKLHLTDAGLLLHRRAASAIAEIIDAERAATALVEEPRGLLRVSAPVSFGVQVLPDLVNDLLLTHPGLAIALDLTDRLVDLIAEGFDAAVRVGPLADSSLIARRVGSTTLRLFASPAYLGRRGVPVTPEDLAEHDALIFGTTPEASWPLRGARASKGVRVRGRLASPSFTVLRDAALAGLGIARLPEIVGIDAARAGRLRTVLDDHLPPDAPIHVIYPSARHVSPRVQVFTERLRAHLQRFT